VHPLRIDHMPALGRSSEAREKRRLTLSDVAEQIHIRSVYLNAIENEDWTAIGHRSMSAGSSEPMRGSWPWTRRTRSRCSTGTRR